MERLYCCICSKRGSDGVDSVACQLVDGELLCEEGDPIEGLVLTSTCVFFTFLLSRLCCFRSRLRKHICGTTHANKFCDIYNEKEPSFPRTIVGWKGRPKSKIGFADCNHLQLVSRCRRKSLVLLPRDSSSLLWSHFRRRHSLGHRPKDSSSLRSVIPRRRHSLHPRRHSQLFQSQEDLLLTNNR